MEKIGNSVELKKAITELKHRQDNEWSMLRLRFADIGDTLKPHNLVKDGLREIITNDNFKSAAINLALALTTGLVIKTIFPAKSIGTLAKIISGSVAGIAATRRFLKSGPGH
jgi:hypothetical protein